MAAGGHLPIRNTPKGGVEAAAFPEVAAFPEAAAAPAPRVRPRRAPRDDETPLVPGYRPPHEVRRARRARAAEAEPDGAEAAIEVAAVPPVPDAAQGSFGDISVLEVIIGNDDRVPLADDLIRTDPWRQICALRIRSATGAPFVGTGWFIGPNVLATAAHCVFMRDEGGWASSIDVIPGLAGTVEPYGRATSTRFASVAGWRDTGGRDFDYGVIFLDDPGLGTRVGSFAVETESDADLEGALSRISGYPNDIEHATRQYYHERPLKSVTPTRLNYEIDTFGGQSGSPIWRQVQGRGPVVVGIHTTGTVTGNSGTRIIDPVLDNLIAWAGEPA